MGGKRSKDVKSKKREIEVRQEEKSLVSRIPIRIKSDIFNMNAIFCPQHGRVILNQRRISSCHSGLLQCPVHNHVPKPTQSFLNVERQSQIHHSRTERDVEEEFWNQWKPNKSNSNLSEIPRFFRNMTLRSAENHAQKIKESDQIEEENNHLQKLYNLISNPDQNENKDTEDTTNQKTSLRKQGSASRKLSVEFVIPETDETLQEDKKKDISPKNNSNNRPKSKQLKTKNVPKKSPSNTSVESNSTEENVQRLSSDENLRKSESIVHYESKMPIPNQSMTSSALSEDDDWGFEENVHSQNIPTQNKNNVVTSQTHLSIRNSRIGLVPRTTSNNYITNYVEPVREISTRPSSMSISQRDFQSTNRPNRYNDQQRDQNVAVGPRQNYNTHSSNSTTRHGGIHSSYYATEDQRRRIDKRLNGHHDTLSESRPTPSQTDEMLDNITMPEQDTFIASIEPTYDLKYSDGLGKFSQDNISVKSTHDFNTGFQYGNKKPWGYVQMNEAYFRHNSYLRGGSYPLRAPMRGEGRRSSSSFHSYSR